MNLNLEIICVGNELLIGKTLNTNAQWLATQVTNLGLTTNRITVIGDNIDEISKATKEAIQRKPDFVLTTGGLGPTFDDKTLEGLAHALGETVEVNQEALQMVKEKYQAYAKERGIQPLELTSPRVKMATLPQTAKPLPNPVGTAPAVLLEYKNVAIFALPGVPSEMKAIFDESVAPVLKKAACGVTFFETSIETTNVMESEMAPVVDKVMQNNPNVYIKSHPKGEERLPCIEFHLSTTANNALAAKERVTKAVVQLTELIIQKGGKILSVECVD
jgi:molybdenum cofactor synthesis domain-containing protein